MNSLYLCRVNQARHLDTRALQLRQPHPSRPEDAIRPAPTGVHAAEKWNNKNRHELVHIHTRPQVQCPLNGSASVCDLASRSYTCGTLSTPPPTPRVTETVVQSGYRIEVRVGAGLRGREARSSRTNHNVHAKLYFNGMLDQSLTFTNVVLANEGPMHVGGDPWLPGMQVGGVVAPGWTFLMPASFIIV